MGGAGVTFTKEVVTDGLNANRSFAMWIVAGAPQPTLANVKEFLAGACPPNPSKRSPQILSNEAKRQRGVGGLCRTRASKEEQTCRRWHNLF